MDGEGNIFVADSGNNRIQKFTANGQFLSAVGTKGEGPLQFILLSFSCCIINAGMRNKEWPGSLYCVSNPGYVVYTMLSSSL